MRLIKQSLTIHSLARDALENERQDPQNINNPIHPYVPFNISRLKSPSSFQGGEDEGWKKHVHHHILVLHITQYDEFKGKKETSV